jgi:hypothetical protein
MPLEVHKKQLTAKFSWITNAEIDELGYNINNVPWLFDILLWSDAWSWECTTTINSKNDNIQWKFNSGQELEEFLVLFALKWGKMTHVRFLDND